MNQVWIVSVRLRSLLMACGILALVLAFGIVTARGVDRHAQTRTLSGITVAVDAGHGGRDRGACHLPSDLIEKEINLDMADRVGERLAQLGARVVRIREDDRFLELEQRSQIANEERADLLISLHVNRIPGHPDCYGAQTFYFPGRKESERFAAILQEELIAIDPDNYRSPVAGEYRVLRLAEMPAVIVEIGFMTSGRDRRLMATEAYRDKVADAIVAGVVRYAAEKSWPDGE